jgi:hypothetical protein
MVLIMRKQEYENAMESNKNAVASGYSHRWEFRHGAEIFGTIDNASELAPFARSVVVGAIKKRGRR